MKHDRKAVLILAIVLSVVWILYGWSCVSRFPRYYSRYSQPYLLLDAIVLLFLAVGAGIWWHRYLVCRKRDRQSEESSAENHGRKKSVMWYAIIFTLNTAIWLLSLLRFRIQGDALSLFTLSMFVLLAITSVVWWLYWSRMKDDS